MDDLDDELGSGQVLAGRAELKAGVDDGDDEQGTEGGRVGQLTSSVQDVDVAGVTEFLVNGNFVNSKKLFCTNPRQPDL